MVCITIIHLKAKDLSIETRKGVFDIPSDFKKKLAK
jgi:hypothetical protein